ncbi:MAG: peptidase S10 [Myxococcota bacterium]|nr:peptidase S10 [Myxococcota bacterium]
MNDTKDAKGTNTKEDSVPLPEERAVVTNHQMQVGDRKIDYTATAGIMHIRNEKEKKAAAIFYTAYIEQNANPTTRPITFCFNGGPGSCSVWLHLGAFGPKRIDMIDKEPPRPNHARLVDNEYTLLTQTDLVFIDPVGTGFSRSGEEGKDEDFFNVEGDAQSLSQFIQQYISQNQRWTSPKFLAGESYGTTRSGLMAKILGEKGVALNGLILVSLAVNFQTFIAGLGNDLPYLLFLPTFTATAWHQGKIAPNLAPNLDALLKEVRDWAFDVYAPALLKGSLLSHDDKYRIAQKLSQYTGIDVDDIMNLNLRIADMRFAKSVLNRPGYTVGRMDGRYVGSDVDPDHRRTQTDPSINAPMGSYTGLINDHISRTLGFTSPHDYHILNMKTNQSWKWERKNHLGYPNTAPDLRAAMITNPHMQVLFANGLFDLATPFFAAEYTAAHMNLPPELRENIHLTYYPAGHMMYFHRESHQQLTADIFDLFHKSIAKEPKGTP